MIKISNRLKTVADIVLSNKSKKIIDIGCDHALLDIYLLQNNSELKIIASDNKEKPLENAKKNIIKYSFFKKIEVCLKEGINNLDKDIDTIVISGMGADNIINILNKDKEELKHINRFVISSNNKYPKLRENIIKLGYYINNEKIVFEDNKFYIIIEFVKGNKKYNKKELYFGPILLNNKDELFFKYYKSIIKKYELILKNTDNKEIINELKLLYEEI